MINFQDPKTKKMLMIGGVVLVVIIIIIIVVVMSKSSKSKSHADKAKAAAAQAKIHANKAAEQAQIAKNQAQQAQKLAVAPTQVNINATIDTNTKPFFIQSATTKYFFSIEKGMVADISDATSFTNDARVISPIVSTYTWNIAKASDYSSTWVGGDKLVTLYLMNGGSPVTIIMNNALGSPTTGDSSVVGGSSFLPNALVNLITLG